MVEYYNVITKAHNGKEARLRELTGVNGRPKTMAHGDMNMASPICRDVRCEPLCLPRRIRMSDLSANRMAAKNYIHE